jgi:hypothetical protein
MEYSPHHRGWMKLNLLLSVAGLAMTVCTSKAGDLSPPAAAESNSDPATKLVVQLTNNHWTADRVLIVTGTLTNTNAVPVKVTKIIATGFDQQRNAVADGSGSSQEASYTIGNAEIAAGAAAVFEVALSDAKKVIRFVKTTPYVAPIPTPISMATAQAIPTPTPDLFKLAGPMPRVDGFWGVSPYVHTAIKNRLLNPDSYQYIGANPPKISAYAGKPCWLELVKFRSKDRFGSYAITTAGVFVVVEPGGGETILDVEIAETAR